MSKGYRIPHGMIMNILDIHPELSEMLQHLPQLSNPYSVRQLVEGEKWPRDFTFKDEQGERNGREAT